jgi:endonuclease-8
VPEGHTIRRKVVDQEPWLVGRALAVVSPNRRFESGAAALDGLRLERMDAWGKNLFYFFPGRRVLHVHLGMDGRFSHHRLPAAGLPPPSRDELLRVTGPELSFDLRRPKICRLLDEVHCRRIVSRLGPDPLRRDADLAEAARRLRLSPASIGAALLDQSVVAGIGNVYRAEILFSCAVHPDRPAATVGDEEWSRMWDCASRLLASGVEHRGEIVTVDPREPAARGERKTYVYGQRVCARCAGPVRRWQQAGRVCFACEACQKPPAVSH